MSITCVRAASLILGDKWTPQLIRAIYNCKTLRFCRLQDEVGGINPRTLTAKLLKLENDGIIVKNQTETHNEYKLTKRGEDLVPILDAMGQWSEKYAQPTSLS